MLAHFYHVWADGAWQDPLAEHLAALKASGLGAALDYKAAGIVGRPANCQAAIAELGGWQIAATAAAGHEEVTLRKLHAFAALDGKAFYAHTKGAADPSRRNILWRRRMTYYCAGKWEQAVAALDEHDCAGPHWLTAERYWGCPVPPWRCWFGGNFWWANLSFLRRLAPLADGDRWEAERWIGASGPVDAHNMLPVLPDDGLETMSAQVDEWRLAG
jgi:hypothetical protein